MKRKISVLLCIAALSLLSGCGNEESSAAEVTTRLVPSSVNLNADRQTSSDSARNGDSTADSDNAADYFLLAQESRLAGYCEAYESGDYTTLAENEQYVLENAAEVIEKLITEDMTDYQKVHAIHDYMILNCTYDTDELDERKGADVLSYCPEGFFKNGKAICAGYSSTFQLFMDLLEIPCITVENAYANQPGNDHAWNIVYVQDKWYYVDITWDDPIPDMNIKYHSFLLVSSAEMESTGHIWDEDKYPYVKNSFVRDWNCY